MKIAEVAIKRPIYVIVFFTVLTILGYLSYQSLSAELMPKFTPPMINIQMVYPGASPSEVENSLTRKLEEAISSMEGIDRTALDALAFTSQQRADNANAPRAGSLERIVQTFHSRAVKL